VAEAAEAVRDRSGAAGASATEALADRVARRDPELRRRRGIYATPRPLVLFVVRSLHALLKDRFEKPAGLADPAVRLLDPCAGPMTFLLEAWRLALAEGESHGIRPAALLRRHLLPHSRGIEIVPELVELGHAAVLECLDDHGLRLRDDERPPLELGDALAEPTGAASALLPALAPLWSDAAGARSSSPIPVVLGNPPYRGHSANRGRWIGELLHGYRLPDGREDDGYYRVDGHGLGERNPKWLQDDAVKFLRLAQWHVDRAGQGLVAYVLSHNVLDAPTFRGVRASLLRTFEEVYALDLHGNRRKRERQPDDRPDGNVFRGVAQGIAVLLLVKRPGLARRVLRADLYGEREAKLQTLLQADIASTPWAELRPQSPSYLWVAGESDGDRRYRRELSLAEIFSVRTTGIITGRDAVLTDLNRGALEARLAAAPSEPHAGARRPLTAAELLALRADGEWQRRIAPLVVRPFDVRQVIYDGRLLARPRQAVMDHMLRGDNLGLVVARQCKEEPGALVTSWLVGHKAVSAYDVNTLFPLFVRCEPGRGGASHHLSNIRPELRNRLSELYGRSADPAEILAYLYAVLYSPAYRARYRRLLQRDFPRIPFPRTAKAFEVMSRFGRELVDLHVLRDERLLRSNVVLRGDVRRPLARNRAEACDYRESEGRVYLAEHGLSFEGLVPEVWRYRIGGHQVLKRWLQARRGRVLQRQDINQFRWAAQALDLTLALEAPLAEAYRSVEDDCATVRG
jgi:predicted helicase